MGKDLKFLSKYFLIPHYFYQLKISEIKELNGIDSKSEKLSL